MARLKGVYGKPWSKMAGDVELTPELLKRLGEELLKSVVAEARVDLAKQGHSPTPKGQPEGIPATPNFFESFDYRIVGRSTIEITSEWDWIEEITEGRDSYQMTWLSGERGVRQVPMMQSDGTVLVRMAPFKTSDAWIHPGFAKHTFVQRGIKKARKKMAQMVMREFMERLAQGDPTR